MRRDSRTRLRASFGRISGCHDQAARGRVQNRDLVGDGGSKRGHGYDGNSEQGSVEPAIRFWLVYRSTHVPCCARIASNLPPHQIVPYYERMPPGSGDDTALNRVSRCRPFLANCPVGSDQSIQGASDRSLTTRRTLARSSAALMNPAMRLRAVVRLCIKPGVAANPPWPRQRIAGFCYAWQGSAALAQPCERAR